jgi:hypothetical protein
LLRGIERRCRALGSITWLVTGLLLDRMEKAAGPRAFQRARSLKLRRALCLAPPVVRPERSASYDEWKKSTLKA